MLMSAAAGAGPKSDGVEFEQIRQEDDFAH